MIPIVVFGLLGLPSSAVENPVEARREFSCSKYAMAREMRVDVVGNAGPKHFGIIIYNDEVVKFYATIEGTSPRLSSEDADDDGSSDLILRFRTDDGAHHLQIYAISECDLRWFRGGAFNDEAADPVIEPASMGSPLRVHTTIASFEWNGLEFTKADVQSN